MPEPVPVVIVAAGRGVRFGGPVPKPVTTLAGKAVVAMSVEAMAAGGCTHAVVVIPRNAEHHFQPALAASPIPVTLVEGDETRQASVRRGIAAIRGLAGLAGARVVLVHDAVRPLVPATVVTRVIRSIREGQVAVAPAIPVADSIREEAPDGRLTIVDRDRLRAIQTPQAFDLDVLEASHAYTAEQGIECTDDLSVCEAAGHPVSLVKGAMTALKITSATDLDLAHAFLKLRAGVGRHSFRRVLRHRPFAWFVKRNEVVPDVIRSPR
ncbi:MAG: 2-C-methyl-D-erythritol 4-phosphate cytidylyltransferase [Micropruina sp.]|uniref:2-C-methyl-D-erythritol 4-phosphate cytidylyltransferase n=1 Tax=Micropruina sp. TaxID=2737536 RepID=UPI0039E687C5